MLSLLTLRNIFKKDFEAFFRKHKVKKRSIRIRSQGNQELYVPIKRMLENELESGESFTAEELHEFFYEQLFYSNNNLHYIYQYDEISFADKQSFDELQAFFEHHKDSFKTGQLILDTIPNDEIVLCNTYLESAENQVKSINFFFKIGTVVIDNLNQNFFCGVTIDLIHNLVIFKFNQNSLDNFESDPLDVLTSLKSILNGENDEYSYFIELGLNVIGFNEETPKELISKLFKELSSEAEEILNAEVPKNTDKDIENFLKDKGLPCSVDYIQQIKSVLFQEISQRCANTMFKSGWVFRFIFREGQFTKASSRTENRSPIYGSKVYWHLKELIFKNNEMYEAGFLWYLNNPAEEETPKFVDVRFEARNDYLINHYYYKMRGPDRKEKEEFVLQKIRNYLQEHGD